jgi:hypothetical protein
MPFNFNSLANVVFLIVNTNIIFYIFLIVVSLEEFRRLVYSEVSS